MAEFREERVSTERVVDDPVVDREVVADRQVAVDPVRRGNPAPVIAAICIALLLAFLIFFGMSRTGNDDSNDDGVRVTVPQDLDGNDENDGGSGSTGSNTDTNTDTSTKTETSTKP